MKAILFTIAFLSSFCCFSQLNEDFTDGDFTQNPTWTGDTDKFIVDKKNQLRLHDTNNKGGYASLYTESIRLAETTWEFYVHLLFNPSINNYGLFFLASDSYKLSESNGYVVKIGGENDCITLCRMDKGTLETLIESRLLMKEQNSPQLKIKVECDNNGNWTLWTQLVDNESDYTKEGTFRDIQYSSSKVTGIGCVYTSSRSNSFLFDNLFITRSDSPPIKPDDPETPDSQDITPPKIIRLEAINETIVSIRFNEAVNIGKASFKIDPNHKIINRILSTDKSQLDLILSTPLEINHEYVLSISEVSDVVGNKMAESHVNFRYYDAQVQVANFADVVFNEIMANPEGIRAFPESEYIELFNRTDVPINLKNWKLYYGSNPHLLPDVLLKPKSLLILCHQKFLQRWNDLGIESVGLSSFPTLSNAGKLLYLEDSNNRLISWINYSDAWYKDDFKKSGGFSLECIDPDNLSADASNWTASIHKDGATPGKENSVKATFPDDTRGEISHYYMKTPDSLIVCFTKPMDHLSLSIHDNYDFKNLKYSLLSATPIYPECKSVVLALSNSLQEELEISTSDLKDISGYGLEGELSFRVNMPEPPEKGDVVFNEVMFNPFPDENDYVELFNCSTKYISLEELRFSSHKKDGTLCEAMPLTTDKRIFVPHTYLCFTKNTRSLNNRYSICLKNIITTNNLPTLPEDNGNILLTDSQGNILDELVYTEKMHSSLINDKKGIALEKIYPQLDSQSSSNWVSASTASGEGTPGCENSQYRKPTTETDRIFWLENESFSPDGDGINDEAIIAYHSVDENVQANVKIFDAAGRLISIVAESSRLEPNGIFTWNGANNNNQIASTGIYIILVETYNPVGKIKHYKLACALTK